MNRVDSAKASAMLYELSKMEPIVVGTAYLYAKNYVKYGVDVTKAWDTATEQTAALEIAYHKGACDAESYIRYAYRKSDEDGNIFCSRCGSGNCFDDYCGNCGAKMKEV